MTSYQYWVFPLIGSLHLFNAMAHPYVPSSTYRHVPSLYSIQYLARGVEGATWMGVVTVLQEDKSCLSSLFAWSICKVTTTHVFTDFVHSWLLRISGKYSLVDLSRVARCAVSVSQRSHAFVVGIGIEHVTSTTLEQPSLLSITPDYLWIPYNHLTDLHVSRRQRQTAQHQRILWRHKQVSPPITWWVRLGLCRNRLCLTQPNIFIGTG